MCTKGFWDLVCPVTTLEVTDLTLLPHGGREIGGGVKSEAFFMLRSASFRSYSFALT